MKLSDLLSPDTVVPGIRTLNDEAMTIAMVEDYQRNDWRIYDARCPFSMSHTKHWCGYERCSDG
jgi:hypothetical protein